VSRTALTVPCRFCGRPVDTGHPGAYLHVEGWAPVRDAGGANTIALRKDLGGAAHGSCIDTARNGGVIQASLL